MLATIVTLVAFIYLVTYAHLPERVTLSGLLIVTVLIVSLTLDNICFAQLRIHTERLKGDLDKGLRIFNFVSTVIKKTINVLVDDWFKGLKYGPCAILTTLMGIAVLVLASDVIPQSRLNTQRQILLRRLSNDLNSKYYAAGRSKGVVVWWPASYPTEWTSPWETPEKGSLPYCVPLGWATFSPHFDAVLRANNIDNLFQAISARKDMFVGCLSLDHAEGLRRYLNAHYQKDVEFEVTDRYNFDTQIAGRYAQIILGHFVEPNTERRDVAQDH